MATVSKTANAVARTQSIERARNEINNTQSPIMAEVDVVVQTVLKYYIVPVAVLVLILWALREQLADGILRLRSKVSTYVHGSLLGRRTTKHRRRLLVGIHDMIFIGAPSPRSLAREGTAARPTSSNPLLTVLEIHCASNTNLEHYPDHIRVIYTNDNPYTEQRLRAENSGSSDSRIELRYLLSAPDEVKGLQDSTVDVVVASHALSSVQDIQATLQEILRVLKPGGKLMYLDHVLADDRTWTNRLQKKTNCIFRLLLSGHDLCRRLTIDIQQAGFQLVKSEHLWIPYNFPLNVLSPHVLGVATKRR